MQSKAVTNEEKGAPERSGRRRRSRRGSKGRSRRTANRSIKRALIGVLLFVATIGAVYIALAIFNAGLDFSWLRE